MESLIAMVAFSEAPFDRTSAASSLAAGNSPSSSNVPKAAPSRLALLAAKWPMERVAAMMAFCEAPFDGAWALSPGAAVGGRACATNVPEAPARLAAAAKTKKRPVDRLVATMAFCEAPFDGTFDGTSSDAAGDVEDTAALRRRPWLADAKELERVAIAAAAAAAGERKG
ncbi:uncharacterized protein LOC100276407 [Zea mays]|nr:uncharacterized protein LOC100276407 [Zea mays]|eukprot:NP_001143682.2 uncharacterized protein LOC100276407 [Zea mays]